MSVAANVDLVMDQGSDFALQVYWTSGENKPFAVQGPMRMEIRSDVGGIVATLQTDETSEDEDIEGTSISYNTDSGLVQLYIDAETSDTFPSGQHSYDLFISYLDESIQRVRRARLLYGRVLVNGRVTRSI